MSAKWGGGREGIVAEIEAMEGDPEIRRRAIDYSSRYSLYDLSYLCARRDVERERATAPMERTVGADRPMDFGEWLTATREFLAVCAWANVLAVVLGAALLLGVGYAWAVWFAALRALAL